MHNHSGVSAAAIRRLSPFATSGPAAKQAPELQ